MHTVARVMLLAITVTVGAAVCAASATCPAGAGSSSVVLPGGHDCAFLAPLGSSCHAVVDGAAPASVHSDAENDAVRGLTSSPIELGGFVVTGSDGTKQPVWLDGSSFSFSKLPAGTTLTSSGYILLGAGSTTTAWSVSWNTVTVRNLCRVALSDPTTTLPASTTAAPTTTLPPPPTTTDVPTTTEAATTSEPVATNTTEAAVPQTNVTSAVAETTTTNASVPTTAEMSTTPAPTPAVTNATTNATVTWQPTTTVAPVTTIPLTLDARGCVRLAALLPPLRDDVAAMFDVEAQDAAVSPASAGIIRLRGMNNAAAADGPRVNAALAHLAFALVIGADAACPTNAAAYTVRAVVDSTGVAGLPMQPSWQAPATDAASFTVCGRATPIAVDAERTWPSSECTNVAPNAPTGTSWSSDGAVRFATAINVRRNVSIGAVAVSASVGPTGNSASPFRRTNAIVADAGATVVLSSQCAAGSVAAVVSLHTAVPVSAAAAGAEGALRLVLTAGEAANVTFIAAESNRLIVAIPCVKASSESDDANAAFEGSLAIHDSALAGVTVRFEPSAALEFAIASSAAGGSGSAATGSRERTFWVRGAAAAPDATIEVAAARVGRQATVHFVDCGFAAEVARTQAHGSGINCAADAAAKKNIDTAAWLPVPLVPYSPLHDHDVHLGHSNATHAMATAAFALSSEAHLSGATRGHSVCVCLGHLAHDDDTVPTYVAVPPTLGRITTVSPTITGIRAGNADVSSTTLRLPFGFAGNVTLDGALGTAAAVEGLALVVCRSDGGDSAAPIVPRFYGLPDGTRAVGFVALEATTSDVSSRNGTSLALCLRAPPRAQSPADAAVETPTGLRVTIAVAGDARYYGTVKKAATVSVGTVAEVGVVLAAPAAGADEEEEEDVTAGGIDAAPALTVAAPAPMTAITASERIAVERGSWATGSVTSVSAPAASLDNGTAVPLPPATSGSHSSTEEPTSTTSAPQVLLASLYSDASCRAGSRAVDYYVPLSVSTRSATRVRFLPADFRGASSRLRTSPTASVTLFWCVAVAQGSVSSVTGNWSLVIAAGASRRSLGLTVVLRPAISTLPTTRVGTVRVLAHQSTSGAVFVDADKQVRIPAGGAATIAVELAPIRGSAIVSSIDERAASLVVREASTTTVLGMAEVVQADGRTWLVASVVAPRRAAEAVIVVGALPGDEHADDAIAVASHVDAASDFDITVVADRSATADSTSASAEACTAISVVAPAFEASGPNTLAAAVGFATVYRLAAASGSPIAQGCSLRLSFELDGSCRQSKGGVDATVGANGTLVASFGVLPLGQPRLCTTTTAGDSQSFTGIHVVGLDVRTVSRAPRAIVTRRRLGAAAVVDAAALGGSVAAAFSGEQSIALPLRSAACQPSDREGRGRSAVLGEYGNFVMSAPELETAASAGVAMRWCYFEAASALPETYVTAADASLANAIAPAAQPWFVWHPVAIRVTAGASGFLVVPASVPVADGSSIAFVDASTGASCAALNSMPVGTVSTSRVSQQRVELRASAFDALQFAAPLTRIGRACLANPLTQTWQALGLLLIAVDPVSTTIANGTNTAHIETVHVAVDGVTDADVAIHVSDAIASFASAAHAVFVEHHHQHVGTRCDVRAAAAHGAVVRSHRPRRVDIETTGTVVVRVAAAVAAAIPAGRSSATFALCLAFADGHTDTATADANSSGDGALYDTGIDVAVFAASFAWSSVGTHHGVTSALSYPDGSAVFRLNAEASGALAHAINPVLHGAAAFKAIIVQESVAADADVVGVDSAIPASMRAAQWFEPVAACGPSAVCAVVHDHEGATSSVRCGGCRGPASATSSLLVQWAPSSVGATIALAASGLPRSGLVLGSYPSLTAMTVPAPFAGSATFPSEWPHGGAVEVRSAAPGGDSATSAAGHHVDHPYRCTGCNLTTFDVDSVAVPAEDRAAAPIQQGSRLEWSDGSSAVALPHAVATTRRLSCGCIVDADLSKTVVALPAAVAAGTNVSLVGSRMHIAGTDAAVDARDVAAVEADTVETAFIIHPATVGGRFDTWSPGNAASLRVAITGTRAHALAMNATLQLGTAIQTDAAACTWAANATAAMPTAAINQVAYVFEASLPPAADADWRDGTRAVCARLVSASGVPTAWAIVASADSGADVPVVNNRRFATVRTLGFDTTVSVLAHHGPTVPFAVGGTSGHVAELLFVADRQDADPVGRACDPDQFTAVGAVTVTNGTMHGHGFGTIELPRMLAARDATTNTQVCVRAGTDLRDGRAVYAPAEVTFAVISPTAVDTPAVYVARPTTALILFGATRASPLSDAALYDVICGDVLKLATAPCRANVVIAPLVGAANEAAAGTTTTTQAVSAAVFSVLVRPRLFAHVTAAEGIAKADAIVRSLAEEIRNSPTETNRFAAVECALVYTANGTAVPGFERAFGATAARASGGTNNGTTNGTGGGESEAVSGSQYYLFFLLLVVPSTLFVMFQSAKGEPRAADATATKTKQSGIETGATTGSPPATKSFAKTTTTTTTTATGPKKKITISPGNPATISADSVEMREARRLKMKLDQESHDLLERMRAKEGARKAARASSSTAAAPLYAEDTEEAAAAAAAVDERRDTSTATSLRPPSEAAATTSPSPRRPGDRDSRSPSQRGGSPSVRGKFGEIAAEPVRALDPEVDRVRSAEKDEATASPKPSPKPPVSVTPASLSSTVAGGGDEDVTPDSPKTPFQRVDTSADVVEQPAAATATAASGSHADAASNSSSASTAPPGSPAVGHPRNSSSDEQDPTKKAADGNDDGADGKSDDDAGLRTTPPPPPPLSSSQQQPGHTSSFGHHRDEQLLPTPNRRQAADEDEEDPLYG